MKPRKPCLLVVKARKILNETDEPLLVYIPVPISLFRGFPQNRGNFGVSVPFPRNRQILPQNREIGFRHYCNFINLFSWRDTTTVFGFLNLFTVYDMPDFKKPLL